MATRRAIIERGDVTVDAETGVVLPVPRPQRVVGRASSEAVVAPGYPAPKTAWAAVSGARRASSRGSES